MFEIFFELMSFNFLNSSATKAFNWAEVCGFLLYTLFFSSLLTSSTGLRSGENGGKKFEVMSRCWKCSAVDPAGCGVAPSRNNWIGGGTENFSHFRDAGLKPLCTSTLSHIETSALVARINCYNILDSLDWFSLLGEKSSLEECWSSFDVQPAQP